MKRSAQVPAALVIALASLSVAGCRSNRTVRECVDSMGRIVPDSQCISGANGAHWVTRTVQSGGYGSTSGGYYGG